MALDFMNDKRQGLSDQIRRHLAKSAGFSLERLLDLDGIGCAVAIAKHYPPSQLDSKAVLVFVEDRYSSGVALTCAQHLNHLGYYPVIYFSSPNQHLVLKDLKEQCIYLGIPLMEGNILKPSVLESFVELFVNTSASFFSGTSPEVVTFRESCTIPIVSIDCVPKEWYAMEQPGYARPDLLISLMYTNKDAKCFKGCYHCLVGNYITAETLKRFKPDDANLLNIPKFTKGRYFVKL